MKKTLQLLLLLSIFLSSCTTQRMAVLRPNVSEKYQDREGFVTQKGDSLDVTFGYLFSTKDHLVFEVEVKNNTQDSILVEPKNFSFQSVLANDASNLSKPFFALTFEQISNQLEERVREARIKTILIVLAAVATVVAIDVAAKNHNQRSPRYRDYSRPIHVGLDLFSFNYFDAVIYDQLSKKEARKGLENSVMFARKIGPSESHIGAVYFPRCDDVTQLLFNFKTSDQDFKTLFRQTIQTR